MTQPLVSIGMPVFRGVGLIEETLRVVLDQTYQNIEVILSVDGSDEESAEVCKPFLSDERVRMTVQSQQLGWAGNIRWTMDQHRGDYFVYHQQDDGLSPNYIEALVQVAEAHPEISVCYAPMDVVTPEGHHWVDRHKSITGSPISRVLTHLERMDTSMFRGLTRSSMARRTNSLTAGPFESFATDLVFNAELLLHGEFRLVADATYFKRVLKTGTHIKWYTWEESRKAAAWASFGARMLATLMPAGKTAIERWHLFLVIADRFITPRGGQRWIFCALTDTDHAARWAVLEAMIRGAEQRWGLNVAQLLETSPEEFRRAVFAYFDWPDQIEIDPISLND